jgi:hypothetical protein
VGRPLHLGVVVVGLDDGQDAGALLAGRLGDQLLGPVGESDDARAVVDDGQLVAQRLCAADRRAEAKRGVRVVVGGQEVGDRLRVVEQRLDVDSGQPARGPARTRSARSTGRRHRGRR